MRPVDSRVPAASSGTPPPVDWAPRTGAEVGRFSCQDWAPPRGAYPMSSTRPKPSSSLATVTEAVVGGVALGLFAALADKSIVTTSLGQMVSPWAALAAIVGGRSRRGRAEAAIGGAVSLTAANATYYVFGLLAANIQTPRYWALWTVIGVLVGPLAALTGWHSRFGPRRLRVLGAALLAAVALAEGVVLWGHIDHPEAHITYVAVGLIGLLLPSALLRDEGARLRAAATGLSVVLAVPLGFFFEAAFSAIGIV